jgi:hypothetical protein
MRSTTPGAKVSHSRLTCWLLAVYVPTECQDNELVDPTLQTTGHAQTVSVGFEFSIRISVLSMLNLDTDGPVPVAFAVSKAPSQYGRVVDKHQCSGGMGMCGFDSILLMDCRSGSEGR